MPAPSCAVGITKDLQPVIFEINEMPWTGHTAPQIQPIVKDSWRDLLTMVAADLSRDAKVAISDREAYEMGHRGGWKRLRPL